jgi:uncharacterized protein (TIRG00374 family)
LSLGIAVSLACLYFATRGTDWGHVGTVLAGTRPGWVVATVLVSLATVYVRAQRWRVLLRPLGDVPLYPALSATAIGFGASAVLPFRIGEIVRPALLGRRTKIGISGAFSSVVLERLFDMLLVIACFLLVSVAYPVPNEQRLAALTLAALAAIGLGVLLVMHRNRPRAEALIGRALGWLPGRIGRGLAPVTSSFLNGLGGLSDLPTVLTVLAYSAYLWGIIMLTFLFSFLALDIRVPLVAASLTTVVVVAAAVFLPQAPGFVGTWQLGCVTALSLFGVTNIGAASIFLARENLSVGQLVREAEQVPAPGER